MAANQPLDRTNRTQPSSSYDVFISYFREDAGAGLFGANLHKALTDESIHTFVDDNKRSEDNEIAPELSNVINESKIALIVFSKNYASSSFCLEALSYIIDNSHHSDRTYASVLPIFYDVDPSEMRKQSGPYAEAFTKHKERLKDNRDIVMKWRRVLSEVARLSGWTIDHRYPNGFLNINDIVKQVLKSSARNEKQQTSQSTPDVSQITQSTFDVSQNSHSTPDDSQNTRSTRDVFQVILQISHKVFQAEMTWRLVGLMSSVVGMLCYALSPSFNRLYGRWKPFNFFLYGSFSLAIFTTILFARKTSSSSQHVQRKTFTSFAVLLIISVYSFFYDKASEWKT